MTWQIFIHKIALTTSFLTGTISKARIILQPTVYYWEIDHFVRFIWSYPYYMFWKKKGKNLLWLLSLKVDQTDYAMTRSELLTGEDHRSYRWTLYHMSDPLCSKQNNNFSLLLHIVLFPQANEKGFWLFNFGKRVSTVGCKIIRALEVIRFKETIPNTVLWNKYFLNHDHSVLWHL